MVGRAAAAKEEAQARAVAARAAATKEEARATATAAGPLAVVVTAAVRAAP